MVQALCICVTDRIRHEREGEERRGRNREERGEGRNGVEGRGSSRECVVEEGKSGVEGRGKNGEGRKEQAVHAQLDHAHLMRH